jgi:transposase
MPTMRVQWPDDVEALKSLLVEQITKHDEAAARAAELEQENRRIKAQVLSLQEQLNLALARRYAASSEKISPDQVRLFDEAEVDSEANEADQREGLAAETVVVAEHRRKKRGRKPLPETLLRIDVVHELDPAERRCDQDGAELAEIGEVTSEQLDIIPAQIRVIRHVRKQYACACGQCIKTAPLPPQPIPKSLASPGLLAHVVVSKYADALPLYRQEQILKRIGVDIPRATLANWMIQAGQLIEPLINLMRERLLAHDIVQMDETTVQVLKEPSKRAQSKSYLWVQRGGPPRDPLVLYAYDPSRSRRVPQRLLEGFAGYLQTDGYEAYNAVAARADIVHVGCMAHARRKFADAVKAQGKRQRTGKAWRGLSLIQRLYRIERLMGDAEPAERHAYRHAHARPILDELREWLDASLPQVPPTSATGKALHYLHREWPKLVRYLEDGRLSIDNNRVENAIRPFVVGRKNWLFSDSVRGVKASANLYSLIETAKANGLDPYAYLRYLFAELPKAETVEAIEALLPGNLDPNALDIRPA